MSKAIDYTQYSSYAAMGMSRYDYEACYGYDQEWGLYGLHCHDFYEFYIHFQGAKHYCIDNQVYPLDSCHLMVIPPFRMHGLICDHVPQNYERCFLYMSPGMMKVCGAGQIDLEHFFSTHVRSGHHQFRMTEAEGEECKQLLQSLKQSQDDTSSLGRFSNFTKLLQFITIITRVMHRSHDSIEPIVLNEAMQEILTYVNQNYTTNIKLEHLARKFGVSVSFLSHQFVKYTGRSVYDYVLYRRVLLAKEMIRSTAPLNEVAFHCGFNDYSSFLRTFTRIAGMSPSAYRKRQQIHP
ncbi:MAG: helix-turn-helix domain-containing protein [Aristaeellaceae bacterium]